MHKLSYPWHKADWQHLTAYIEQDRVPQALLMTGSEGLGKHALAMQYTQALLCTDKQASEACLQCESCKLFTANTHPDFMLLQPEEVGKAIKIDDVRAVISKLSLKPQYSAYRVVIIQPADRMNINSANAFLKCLEEPPERTVFLLLTEAMQSLPATIISRCQLMSLSVPKQSDVVGWLAEQGVTEQIDLLLGLAEGSPLRALEYSKNNFLEQRSSCFDAWNKVALGLNCPVSLAEKWQKMPVELLLKWLTLWTEDVVKCTFQTKPSLLFNKDLAGPLQGLAKNANKHKLFKFYDLLLKDSYRIKMQLNKQLLFEELLITWSQVGSGK